MNEIITSVKNPQIKNIVKLQQKSSERKKQNLIVIEGSREISLAIHKEIKIKSLFICTDIFSYSPVDYLNYNGPVIQVSKEVFNKIAYRDSTEGIIALAEPRFYSFADLKIRKNPLIIVLESVEKPGNLGAILRTADAANVDGVIISDPLTDIYNPNVIRSSVGCVFTTQIVVCSSEEAIKWLKQKKIKSYAAALTATKYYHQTDLTGGTAIVMGTEADGLSGKWIENTDEQIKIPMSGEIDSLNVSVSTAVLVFEAKRQRGFS